MAVRQYIGARYVLKIYENSQNPQSAEWEAGVSYEPLVMVNYQNSSYISRKDVPASVGNPVNNPSYWALSGLYNGQIANLQTQINSIGDELSNYKNADFRRIVFPTTNPVNNPTGHITAIQVENHAFLIDIGLAAAWADVERQLQNMGIDTIDGVIISHYHGDHDGNDRSGNYNYLKDSFDWSNCVFYLPLEPPSIIDPATYETTTENSLHTTFPDNTFYKPPYTITWNGFTFDLCNNLASDYSYLVAQNETDYNQYSTIVRVSAPGISFLNFSDVGTVAQTRQMSLGNIKPSDICTVPHHGNEGGCAPGLPELVHPKYLYASDTYTANNNFLRDPFIWKSIEAGAQFIDNVNNYPDTVSGNFSDYATLCGRVNKTVNYGQYNYRKIYYDPNGNPNSYANGTEEYPFFSLQRALSACVGRINELHILDDIASVVGVTGEQNILIIDAENHNVGINPIDGANVTLKNANCPDWFISASDSTLRLKNCTLHKGGGFHNSFVVIDNDCTINENLGSDNSVVCYKNSFLGGSGTIPHD